MAWLAVDRDGITEEIFNEKPTRSDYLWIGQFIAADDDNAPINENGVILPEGTIKKLIGRTLTWNDGPVELK